MDTLNVYALMQHPLRSTASDHLYSMRRHGKGRQFYLNLAVREVPGWVRRARFSAVVYHTTFFSHRWGPGQFEAIVERAAALRGVGRVRVALPQDEFFATDLLVRFVNEFEIDHVFTLAAPGEAAKIYRGVDRDRVGFSQNLPGYLSDATRRRIDRIVDRTRERLIDVGYRAWPGAPWLGRHGLMKGEIGVVVDRAAPAHGLSTDISGRDADVLHGDDWFRFLASCRYTLGVEGGASMLDRDGSIRARTEAYLAQHPDAGFDEVEAACFPGEDGSLRYFAIGPRNIEACATRTCQILVEGDYQGVLRPGEHYIELRRDLSNLSEVLEIARRDELRAEITERAYRDVVASGRFSYAAMVRAIEAVTIPAPREGDAPAVNVVRRPLNRAADALSWLRVIYRIRVRPTAVPGWAAAWTPRHRLRVLRAHFRLAAGKLRGIGRSSKR